MVVKDMGAIIESDRTIDVICQNCRDGRIIPLKIRLTDESGEVQQYKVKEYREITNHSRYVMPNSVEVECHRTIRTFECKIDIFQRERTIVIFYNPKDQIWMYER